MIARIGEGALLTRPAPAGNLLDRGTDYLLTVKGNQPALPSDIRLTCRRLTIPRARATQRSIGASATPELPVLAPELADFAGDSLHVGRRFARMAAPDVERVRNEIDRHAVSLRRRRLLYSLDPIHGALSGRRVTLGNLTIRRCRAARNASGKHARGANILWTARQGSATPVQTSTRSRSGR